MKTRAKNSDRRLTNGFQTKSSICWNPGVRKWGVVWVVGLWVEMKGCRVSGFFFQEGERKSLGGVSYIVFYFCLCTLFLTSMFKVNLFDFRRE